MPTTIWDSTQTSTPTWSPDYQTLNQRLLAGIKGRIEDPSAGTDPLRMSAINAANRRFQGIPQKLATNLASRGYGKSGSLGSGIKGVEFARQGALADIEGKFAEMLLDREDKNYDLATALMGMNRGTTTTGTGESKTSASWLENIMQLTGMALPFLPFGKGKGKEKTDQSDPNKLRGGVNDPENASQYPQYWNSVLGTPKNPEFDEWAGAPTQLLTPVDVNDPKAGWISWRGGMPYIKIDSGMWVPAKKNENTGKWEPMP